MSGIRRLPGRSLSIVSALAHSDCIALPNEPGRNGSGAGVYGMGTNLLYAEQPVTTTLPNRATGCPWVKAELDESDHLQGVAPYWRVALSA